MRFIPSITESVKKIFLPPSPSRLHQLRFLRRSCSSTPELPERSIAAMSEKQTTLCRKTLSREIASHSPPAYTSQKHFVVSSIAGRGPPRTGGRTKKEPRFPWRSTIRNSDEEAFHKPEKLPGLSHHARERLSCVSRKLARDAQRNKDRTICSTLSIHESSTCAGVMNAERPVRDRSRPVITSDSVGWRPPTKGSGRHIPRVMKLLRR
jgi:hypothetical protein